MADAGAQDVSEIGAWASAVESLSTQRMDKVPAGWFTLHDLADKLGRSRSGLQYHITAMRRVGLVEVARFCVCLGGQTRREVHYRLTRGGLKKLQKR